MYLITKNSCLKVFSFRRNWLYLTMKITLDDYVKANRIGSRAAELEVNRGFRAVTRPHKNKKAYTRKSKHKLYLN